MPIAALPDYIGKQDLTSASPGLRFGMYLPLWGKNNRTGELLWETHDINYRVTGKNGKERQFKDENKRDSLRQTSKLNPSDGKAMQALAQRQAALAAPIAVSGQLLTIDARSIAPFTTGLGNEHPLENGFAFLDPYGLPYLPGSGVKGVLRQAARELAGVGGGQWQIEPDWNEETIDALFGREDSNDARRGALDFWDVIPRLKGNALQVEVMTAHQTHYYQKGESPHESGQPNPINFLTVPPGSGFTFHVVCDRPFLARIAPHLAADDRWQAPLRAAFEHAFDWLGFGAKTAVGYGAMAIDKQATAARAATAQQAAIDSLPPDERLLKTVRATYEDEKAKGRLQGGCKTAEARMELLKAAQGWEAAAKQQAVELIATITKDLPWSKKAKKQGIPKQLEALRTSQ